MIVLKEIEKYKDYMIAFRRDFHQHPEPGFQEFRTSKIIEEELLKLGFEVTTGVGKTGLVAVLKGNKDGKTVLLRADIDALRMQEENDVSYKSTIDGMMHACGHDTHTAMLLGACKYFSEHKEELNGTLKVVFQSAEEGPMPGGGHFVVKEGHLDDVDAVFGLHITTAYEYGKISIKKGPAMAAPDEFRIEVIGTGTHASAPQTGVDPILVSSQIVNAFQMITSRNISPTDSVVVSVCTIHGGSAFNIIPESVSMSGTVRTLNLDTRAFVFQRMQSICDNIAKMNNCKVNLEIIEAYPPLINHHKESDFVIDIAKRLLGEDNVEIALEPSMGGEDFSYYLQKKPGSFFWLGGRAKTEKNVYYNHNPKFNVDEDSFVIGACMHINIVKEYLK